MRPFTDEEFDELLHILWTSEDDWDPTSLDSVISDDPNWYEVEPSPPLPDPMYDKIWGVLWTCSYQPTQLAGSLL
jgi:hypothetical protein